MAQAPKSPRRDGAAKPPGAPDRLPTNEELLHELRKHGAPPPPPVALRAVSRRTRDFLLVAGAGSVAIAGGCFRFLGDSDPGNAFKLALTGVAVCTGLTAFVFYGVMGRY